MKAAIEVWLLTLLSGICGSVGVGVLLERLTVLVSYYELTAPGKYMRMSLLWGLPMTAILAAFSTWRVPSRIYRRQASHPIVLAVVAIGLAVLIAGAMGLSSKMAWPGQAGDSGLPASRLWFCRGLHYGVLSISLTGWILLLWREWAVIRAIRSARSVGFSQCSLRNSVAKPSEVNAPEVWSNGESQA